MAAQVGPPGGGQSTIQLATDGASGTGYVVSGNTTLAGVNPNVVGPYLSVGGTPSQTVFTDFSTVGGNGSGGGGGLGGVFFVDNGATLNLTNVTFNNNNTTGGAGGGLPTLSVGQSAFSLSATSINATALGQFEPIVAGTYWSPPDT